MQFFWQVKQRHVAEARAAPLVTSRLLLLSAVCVGGMCALCDTNKGSSKAYQIMWKLMHDAS